TDIVTLSNGLRVTNFNSPHEFKFEDGTILPGRTPEEVEWSKVDMHPEVVSTDNGFSTVVMRPEMSDNAEWLIAYWSGRHLHFQRTIDIVITPLPVLIAMAKTHNQGNLLDSPFRTGVLVDRVNKILSIDKFCTVESTYVPPETNGKLYDGDLFTPLHEDRG
ncbi:MAG: hypothetical protein P1P82_18280, partial [Bacteroidales bacterium]|nr:hypothetical protein [Bacteroidales bacterium]